MEIIEENEKIISEKEVNNEIIISETQKEEEKTDFTELSK